MQKCKFYNNTVTSNLKPSITYSTWWPKNLPRIFLIFTQIVIMYLCFFQPPHSPNTISSHLNLIFSFSKNLKQCFLWKITHKRKSYFYPLGLKQVLSFHFYRDYLKISLCWEWKYNVFVSSRKKYRGPEIDRCLDQRKKTCYIISRTIYLQICIFMNWNKYHAINTPCPRGLGNKENLVIENELL